MQPIEIFRVGKHTAMNGKTIDFDRDAMAAAVAAYKPELHEAPVVVGHPKDNHPAFGWIDHMELTADGVVLAHPKQVDADFAELVKAGRYKKRSASWYEPDSPANPVPGTYYLRHVGFLGAQPPALKGLGDVQFNEAEQGIVEFADTSPFIYSTIAGLLRGVREWLIGKEGLDTANTVLPDYAIKDVEFETQRLLQQPVVEKSAASPFSFSEGNMSTQNQETPEQKIARLEQELATSKQQQTADFSEQEKNLKAREITLAKKEIGVQIDALIAEGKVTQAHKTGLVEFMAGLDESSQTIEFGEGDKAVKQSPRKFMTDFLSNLPKAIEYGEVAGGAGGQPPEELSAQELAVKTTAYHKKQLAAGNHISFSEAAAAVAEGKE